ncbi:MAG: M1 family metallopeptidase [Clostridia bacterium]|nr:M1 family metallopeptidase [Clostridia bacterium]
MISKRRVLALVLAASLVAGLLWAAVLIQGPLAPVEPDRPYCDAYDMYLDIDPAAGTVFGRMALTVQGREEWQEAPGDLWFHLYPNYFASQGVLPIAAEDIAASYPLGFNPGSITIQSLRCNGEEPDYTLTREETLLCVPLKQPLESGEQAEVFLEFWLELPHNRYRFGQNEIGLNLTFFHPQLAYYDGARWHTEPYYSIGDPFVFATADYEIAIKGAQGYQVAAGGVVEWDGDVCRITAQNSRDCAIIMSRGYEVESHTVGKTKVLAYQTKSDGNFALATACSALAALEKRFGPYPYPTFSVVETGLYFYGMEYAGLVQIDTSLYDDERAEELAHTIVHETAHQWFYAAVGSDQVNEPWLDEALTEYATVSHLNLWEKQKMLYNHYGAMGIEGHPGGTLRDYPDSMSYAAQVYLKGSLILRELAEEIGAETLDRALKSYVTENYLGMGTPQALLASIYTHTGKDYSQWLSQKLSPVHN